MVAKWACIVSQEDIKVLTNNLQQDAVLRESGRINEMSPQGRFLEYVAEEGRTFDDV